MTPLDDEGRLFGRVNVVDALVVVVVLGAVVGGLVLLDPFATAPSEPETEGVTRYVTVHLGTQSVAVAERVSAGDDAEGGVAVTDAYVGPVSDGDGVATVVVRLRADGTPADESGVEVDGEPVRRGDQFAVVTADYEAEGEVLAVDADGPTLPTGVTPVVLDAALAPAVADRVEAGDISRLAGRSVAEVDETAVSPVASETGSRTDTGRERAALVGATLRTITLSGETYFGDTPVLLGDRVGFRTDRYAFAGSVTRVGNASPPGVRTNTTATVRVSNLSPTVADAVRAGLVERHRTVTTARIVERSAEPTPVVVTDADGRVYERAHPRNVTLTLTVELRTRRTADGLSFHTRPLRIGSRVAFDFDVVTVRGTVVDIGTDDPTSTDTDAPEDDDTPTGTPTEEPKN